MLARLCLIACLLLGLAAPPSFADEPLRNGLFQPYTAAFAPRAQTSITATTTSSSIALPTPAGPNAPTYSTALITNNGTVPVRLKFGGSSVSAATTDYPIQPGYTVSYDVSGMTNLAGITASGSAQLDITLGYGTPQIAPASSTVTGTFTAGASYGSAGSGAPLAQGTGAANAASLNAYVGGGALSVLNFPATQPVTLSGAPAVTLTSLPAFAATPTFNLGTAPTLTVNTISGFATAANQPSVTAAGTSGTGVTTVQGSPSGVAIPTSNSTAHTDAVAQLAATNGSIPTGANVIGSISNTGFTAAGVSASGAALAENPLADGCRAATTSPTGVTDGQKVAAMCSPEGKGIVKPYAPSGLDWKAFASTTGSSAVTLQVAAATGIKNYVTALQCWNTSVTTITLTLSDSVSTQIIVPSGWGNNIPYPTPLSTAAATALTFTPSSAQTTVGCAAQGYIGP